ncbi:MAG: S-methyl-5'-thioadenosine phosphorylase [Dethiobacteria bacterium]|jgi:5'-methylthioadenosine phosphorylase
MNIDLAIIGGTGFYHPGILKDSKEITINTAFGETQLIAGTYKGVAMAFLARHGREHAVPPHRINYRANIAALKEIGAQRVLSATAVGSLKEQLPPGVLVITDQFIDFTKNRKLTFYEGEEENGVVHTDFTTPYCPQIREHLKTKLNNKGIFFAERGTYICTEGPRYETPAEIQAFALWGADIVGMTNVPEVTLAREAGLCYANLSLVTNFAAGISPRPLNHQEVVEMMEEKLDIIRGVFMETLVSLPPERKCHCWQKEDFPLGQ